MSNLEKMFIEDAPQQVNELNNVESLSSHVLELQKLEDEIKMDEEKFNISIRKFLKNVGITSQREIEKQVRSAILDKKITGNEGLDASVTLKID